MPETNRIEKVNSLLQQQIGKIIHNDFDFGPNVLVTITHVNASANLIQAKVYISVFPDSSTTPAVDKLNRAVYVIQKKINRLLNMRPVPKIKFVIDENPSAAGRVEELLAELKNGKK